MSRPPIATRADAADARLVPTRAAPAPPLVPLPPREGDPGDGARCLLVGPDACTLCALSRPRPVPDARWRAARAPPLQDSTQQHLVDIMKLLGTPSDRDLVAMKATCHAEDLPKLKPYPWERMFPRDSRRRRWTAQRLLRYDPDQRLTASQASPTLLRRRRKALVEGRKRRPSHGRPRRRRCRTTRRA